MTGEIRYRFTVCNKQCILTGKAFVAEVNYGYSYDNDV